MIGRPGVSVVRWIVMAACGVALLLAAIAAAAYMRPAVTVTEVTRGPVVSAFYATGTLLPEREYEVKTPLPGTLRSLDGDAFIDKGSRVKKGQVVAKVLAPDLVYLADKAAAELEEKRARAEEKTSPVLGEMDAKITASREMLEIARREQHRVTQSLETRAASQADLDQAMNRVKTFAGDFESFKAQKEAARLKLVAELEAAQSAHKIAQWNLEQQSLLAPIDGVVLDRPVSIGTRLAINDHVMQIANISPKNLVMRAAVDEENMTRVRLGQKVHMTLYAFSDREKPFVGRVSKIYDKADPDRRTFEIDVKPDEPSEKFAAGMTGELAFIVDEHDDSTVVPAQAIQNDTVYVIRSGRLQPADVKIGIKSIERVEILAGLKEGDTIVISPVGELREGQSVRAGKHVDPRTAAGLNKPKPKELFRGGF